MSNKLYAVVLDENMIVSDIVSGGIAIYENIKTAKVRLEQIYYIAKRHAVKNGIKHTVKKRYSIKEYIIDEPKQDTKWQKLKEFIKTYQEDVVWKNKQVDEFQEELLDKMQELEAEDE